METSITGPFPLIFSLIYFLLDHNFNYHYTLTLIKFQLRFQIMLYSEPQTAKSYYRQTFYCTSHYCTSQILHLFAKWSIWGHLRGSLLYVPTKQFLPVFNRHLKVNMSRNDFIAVALKTASPSVISTLNIGHRSLST